MHAKKPIVCNRTYLFQPIFGSSEVKAIRAGEAVRVVRPASRCEQERGGFYLVETLDGKRKAFASHGSLRELSTVKEAV